MSTRWLTPAVVLVSAATTAYELLLVRLFGVEQFHHFASMAIGVALLGSGASGTLAALAPPADDASGARRLRRAAAATALALVASPWAAHAVHVEPTQLAWTGSQWARLAILVVVLAFPFAAGGLAVLTALVLEPERTGRLYGASFAGGALGVALALAVLFALTPAQALALPPLLAGPAAVALAGRRPASLAGLAALATTGLFLTPVWSPRLTPYKGLVQVSALPGARRVAEHTGPLGWVVAMEAPSFHFAPGLSLAFRGEFPPQRVLLVDGDVAGAATDLRHPAAAPLADALPTSLPHALGPLRRVLLFGAGGGLELEAALVRGADGVLTLEPDRALLGLARALGPLPPAGAMRAEDRVGDPRSLVARSGERFELISLAPASGHGASVGGVHALDADFLHTVDAYLLYLRHLGPGGMLAVTSWVSVPPRESVRTLLTAAEALRRTAGTSATGLLVARSWGTVTVLARPAGFTAQDLERLRSFARERNVDVDWPPAARTDPPANVLDDPSLVQAAEAASRSPDAAARFERDYPFDVAPVDDARPYPHHFLRPSAVRAFLHSPRGTWLPFAEWGPIALAATAVQGMVVSALLLLLPAALWARRGSAPAPVSGLIAFFAALGFAYVTAEVAAIQELSLLLGHPVYAVAAVLTVFLACSGLGSAWSDRLAPSRGPVACALVAGCLGLGAWLLLAVVHRLQGAPLPVRAAAALAAVAPAAFLMGLPFALGLRALARGRGAVAWAWAANGFASVVAAPVGALLGLEAGSRVLLAAAAAAYALAAAIQRLAVGPLRSVER